MIASKFKPRVLNGFVVQTRNGRAWATCSEWHPTRSTADEERRQLLTGGFDAAEVRVTQLGKRGR